MTDGLFANPLHWAILLVIVLIIFGPGKLPSVGNALGKSIKEFKKASQEDAPAAPMQQTTAQQVPAPQPTLAVGSVAVAGPGVTCGSCGKPNPPEGRFCADCGTVLSTSVEPEIVNVAPASVSCAKCGTENSATNRFCVHCGGVVEAATTRA